MICFFRSQTRYISSFFFGGGVRLFHLSLLQTGQPATKLIIPVSSYRIIHPAHKPSPERYPPRLLLFLCVWVGIPYSLHFIAHKINMKRGTAAKILRPKKNNNRLSVLLRNRKLDGVCFPALCFKPQGVLCLCDINIPTECCLRVNCIEYLCVFNVQSNVLENLQLGIKIGE